MREALHAPAPMPQTVESVSPTTGPPSCSSTHERLMWSVTSGTDPWQRTRRDVGLRGND